MLQTGEHDRHRAGQRRTDRRRAPTDDTRRMTMTERKITGADDGGGGSGGDEAPRLRRRQPRRRVLAAATVAVMAVGVGACDLIDQPTSTSRRTDLGIFMTRDPAKDIVTEAKALGVHTVRTSENVATDEVRTKVTQLKAAGLRLVLHMVNGQGPVQPMTTDQQLVAYGTRLDAALVATNPALAAIENEENWKDFYAGDPASYLRQLRVAAEVAHRRNVLVTNGGITSTVVALCTWQHYVDTGQQAKADDFARRVFSAPRDAWILEDLMRKPFTGLRRDSVQESWDKGKVLIAAYRTTPIDYVNFHWYFDDAAALGETITYLRQATGKPVVTTEIGQWSKDPGVVSTDLAQVVSSRHLAFVVWFDSDGFTDSGDPKAVGLHDAPGVLRVTGTTFAGFVAHHRTELR